MKNLELIKEDFFCLADSPDLRTLVMDSGSLHESENEVYVLETWPYGYVCYLDENPKQLINYVLSSHQDNTEGSNKVCNKKLADLLTEENPLNFPELLYVLTMYDPGGCRDSTGRVQPFGPPLVLGDDLIDSLFLESRGRLVYNHQLEVLYQMAIGCPAYQAVQFRKSLWKKEYWAWMEIELLRFPNGNTMKNVMDERMVDEFTFEPNFSGAMKLYQCCLK